MQSLIALFVAAGPALVFLAVPFLFSTVGALLCAAVHRQLQTGKTLPQNSGSWLQQQVLAAGIDHQQVGPAGVEVGVAPAIAGGADGYWPTLHYIGLSPKVWVDRTLAGRTVAAHELGHALLWMHAPTLARRLAVARTTASAGLLVAGTGFLVGALLNHPGSVQLGFVALAVALVAQLGVLADEANASWTGRSHLQRHGLQTWGTDLAMLAAFLVYAIPLLLRSLFLIAAPGFQAALLASPGVAPSNAPLALWSVILLFPILLLRSAQVALETHSPPVRTNSLQLNWTLFQEHAWAFHSGSIVWIWLALSYDQPLVDGLGWWFFLAMIPAMGPLGGIGRLVVLAPLLTLLTLVGFTRPEGRYATPPEPDPLRFLPNADSLFARAGGLMRIAWLPLALVLVRRAISGWS